MTALAGYWGFGGMVDSAARCARMLQAQRVYGQDQPAMWSEGPMAVGRRLASLVPEDRFDRGPVIGAEGSSVLVADARLDNRQELCDELGIAAAESMRLADSSILMKALERWEEDAVERLVGDFALAWWNRRRQRLVLARDFLGQRPLHYHSANGFFAFASMPKGLHALPEIPKGPDRRKMADFLALIPDTGSETFFEAIEKVRPGHIVTVGPDGLSSCRYWEPRRAELRLTSAADYEEALREQLDRAVAARMRGADGRIATHLSGGLDSSAVTATAARLMAGSGSVVAFTAVPRDGYSGGAPRETIPDEGPLAASVAALHPNIEHVRISSSLKSPLETLARDFYLYERPVLNPCNNVWSSAILDEAKRRGLGVLLTGQVGNAGLSYDGMAFLTQLLRRGRLLRLSKEAYALRRHGMRWGTLVAQTIGPFLPVQLWRAITRLRGAENALHEYSAINPALTDTRRLAERAARQGLDFSYRPRSDPFEARTWVLRRTDPGNYNKGILGGWGIDVRDPTADRRLIEFCLSGPTEEYLAGGWTRSLARRALTDRLPAKLLTERRKGYQAVDWHEGLTAARHQIHQEIARMAGCEPAAEALDTEYLRRLVADWPSDNWHHPAVTRRYRLALMRGVSAGSFLRQASGGNA